MTHEQLVTEAIEVIWNRAELDRVEEFYAADFVSHQPESGLTWNPGPDGVREIVSNAKAMFPDYHESIQDVIAQGDRVVLRLWNTGTLAGDGPHAGRTFAVDDYMVVRIADGRIAEQWGLIDLYSMYVQLGMIEPLPF